MATNTLPKVLSIGGFDPSGGAGLQIDILTLLQIGVHPLTAVTAITIQNSFTVKEVYPVSTQTLAEQLEIVIDDYQVEAVKIGMLADRKIVEIVAGFLEKSKFKYVVVDPVIKATSGTCLLRSDALSLFKERVVPLSTILTPNLLEASELVGFSVKSIEDMEKAAQIIYRLGAAWVLVKGGHLSGCECTDILYGGNILSRFPGSRAEPKDVRGTGCILASALAGYLAQGKPVIESVELARGFTLGKIKTAQKIGRGRPQAV